MATAFPASSFTGYDLAGDAIARARDESRQMASGNVAFEVLDVTRLPADPPFELIGRSTLKWPHCSPLIWPHPGRAAVAA